MAALGAQEEDEDEDEDNDEDNESMTAPWPQEYLQTAVLPTILQEYVTRTPIPILPPIPQYPQTPRPPIPLGNVALRVYPLPSVPASASFLLLFAPQHGQVPNKNHAPRTTQRPNRPQLRLTLALRTTQSNRFFLKPSPKPS